MADLGWCYTHDLPGDQDSSCCRVCRAKMEAEGSARKRAQEDALRAEGYAECQRDVVAWATERFGDFSSIARRIEAGEHVGAAKKAQAPDAKTSGAMRGKL